MCRYYNACFFNLKWHFSKQNFSQRVISSSICDLPQSFFRHLKLQNKHALSRHVCHCKFVNLQLRPNNQNLQKWLNEKVYLRQPGTGYPSHCSQLLRYTIQEALRVHNCRQSTPTIHSKTKKKFPKGCLYKVLTDLLRFQVTYCRLPYAYTHTVTLSCSSFSRKVQSKSWKL